MNGTHDMGGMEGLGELAIDKNEPVFHAPWEGRVFGLSIAMSQWRRWTIDMIRHQRELIPGPDYLAMTYFERWFAGLSAMIVKVGLVSQAELASGRAEGARQDPPLTAQAVPAIVARRARPRDEGAPGRFRPGDAVRARTINPHGHTRLPRYARGRTGVVEAYRGEHILPDASAHGLPLDVQPLYSVRFAARELWGPQASPRDSVYLDLWDIYLDPA